MFFKLSRLWALLQLFLFFKGLFEKKKKLFERDFLSLDYFSCNIYLFGVFFPLIGLMSKVFGTGPGDLGSIPGQIIPKTQKIVLDVALLNTQHYKVRIKGKVEQSKEWSSAPHLSVIAIDKGALESPSTKVANFTFGTTPKSTQ